MLVSGGSVAESPALAFVFQGWPLHLPRRLGKREATGTAEQCKAPSEEVGACRKLPSEVPLEGSGYTSQEASAQFSNQVEVRGP